MKRVSIIRDQPRVEADSKMADEPTAVSNAIVIFGFF